MPDTKVCPRCKQELPYTAEFFVRNRSARSGLGTYCKPCQSAKGRESVKKNHGNSRSYHLMGRYGVTEEEVNQLIKDQNGMCPLCSGPLGDKPHLDHSHKTGRVRGILCAGCNLGLGAFKDDIKALLLAIEYLEYHENLEPLPFRTARAYGGRGRPRTREGWGKEVYG